MQELGSGPVVCMLHGLILDNLSSWYLASAGALQATNRVVLYDLRGHGMSERPPVGYDSGTMTADLVGLLDEVAPGEHVTLMGSSYGSYVALKYAMQHSERVPRLVLVELPLPPDRFRDWEHLLTADLKTLQAAIPKDLQKQLVLRPRRARKLLSTVQGLVGDTSLLQDLKAEPRLAEDAVADFDHPVLLIYGSDSNCLSDGEWLASTLPGARLEVLPGSHRILTEQAPQVRTLIESFLAEGQAA